MYIKATVSFVGRKISAVPGQEIECSDEIAKDLISAGYAEKVNKRTTPKGVSKNASKSNNTK